MTGTRGKMQRHTDARDFSKTLFGLLRTLSRPAFADRSGRPVGASGTQDVYVRTANRVTINLQRLAARHVRVSVQDGSDVFDKDHLSTQLRSYLLV